MTEAEKSPEIEDEEKSVKRNISFKPRMIQMLDELAKFKGYPSTSAVIHHAIIDLHNRTFPAYKQSVTRSPLTAKDRKRKIQEEAEAREDMETERQEDIAGRLGGHIVVNRTGGKVCKYFTYTGKSRYLQEVPVSMLTEDLVATQYQPSKEAVEKYQREGKTDYDPKAGPQDAL